jgi:hypothetical protein
MTPYLYTFVGCTTALRHYVRHNHSHGHSADQDTELAACNALRDVSRDLLTAAGQDTSDEKFKELLGLHVVIVLESIEVLRSTPAYQEFNNTILALLEYFYAAGTSLMGGGEGETGGWPTSLTSFGKK